MSRKNSSSNITNIANTSNNINPLNYPNSSNKVLSLWEWEDVQSWLISNNMEKHVSVFENNKVNGYDLCYITNEDLTEMRIVSFHDRNLILRNIRLLTLEQCTNIYINLPYSKNTANKRRQSVYPTT